MRTIFQSSRIFLRATLTLLIAIICVQISHAQTAPFGELQSFWDDREDGSISTIDHSAWQAILDEYLDDETADGINRFNYAGISLGDTNRLEAYLQYLQSVEPRQLNSNEQKAYWINLYNAATVLVVIQEGGDISSIRQIRSGIFTRGPWQLKLLTVLQRELSLDDIEHGILRPIWRDNRIHYAVNCASMGCPNLLKTAFTGANIEALLEKAASDFINHPRGVSVASGELTLSSIFDWYQQDFGSSFRELTDHLSVYAAPDLAAKLLAFNSAFYQYDWDLNGAE